jgi:hypothetical protein
MGGDESYDETLTSVCDFPSLRRSACSSMGRQKNDRWRGDGYDVRSKPWRGYGRARVYPDVKEHGAKLALYDRTSKKVHVLDRQAKATGQRGQTVTNAGKTDSDGKSLPIEAAKTVSAKPAVPWIQFSTGKCFSYFAKGWLLRAAALSLFPCPLLQRHELSSSVLGNGSVATSDANRPHYVATLGE